MMQILIRINGKKIHNITCLNIVRDLEGDCAYKIKEGEKEIGSLVHNRKEGALALAEKAARLVRLSKDPNAVAGIMDAREKLEKIMGEETVG